MPTYSTQNLSKAAEVYLFKLQSDWFWEFRGDEMCSLLPQSHAFSHCRNPKPNHHRVCVAIHNLSNSTENTTVSVSKHSEHTTIMECGAQQQWTV